jgi:hypothetical protein
LSAATALLRMEPSLPEEKSKFDEILGSSGIFWGKFIG